MNNQSALEFTGERIVPQSDQCEPNFAARMFQEHIVRYIFASQITQGKSVIDIGCGVGYGSQHLAERGAKSVYALDLSNEAISHAQIHYAHPNVTFVADNAEEFVVDQQFDVAVCFELIEHVNHPDRVFDRIKKALKPDGVLVMSTPRALEKLRTHFHVHEFSLEEFREEILKYFSNVDMYVENNHFASMVTKDKPSFLPQVICLKDQFHLDCADVFIAVAARSAETRLPELEPVATFDNDAYVTMLERDVEILHKAEDDAREKFEFTQKRNDEIVAFKDREIERITSEYNDLFKKADAASSRAFKAEEQNKHFKEMADAASLRIADSDARRLEAFEFAKRSSDTAHGLQRELDALRQDIIDALDVPKGGPEPTVDHRHREIVESMGRVFFGAEATRYLARHPLAVRVERMALEHRQLLSENEALRDEIAVQHERAQRAENFAQEWHEQLVFVRRSKSWRWTKIFRGVGARLKESR